MYVVAVGCAGCTFLVEARTFHTITTYRPMHVINCAKNIIDDTAKVIKDGVEEAPKETATVHQETEAKFCSKAIMILAIRIFFSCFLNE